MNRCRNIIFKGLSLVVAGSVMASLVFPAAGIQTCITSYAAVSDTVNAGSVLSGSASGAADKTGSHLRIKNPAGRLLNWFLPEGTVIYSDSFPGFYITFNGKESYVIKAGDNSVSLSIRVTDSKLAAQSLAAIKWIFGVTVTDLKKGAILKTQSVMNGIVKGQEKFFYQAALTAGIHDEMMQLFPSDNKIEFKISDPKKLIKALVEAFKEEEEKEKLIKEKEPGGEIIILKVRKKSDDDADDDDDDVEDSEKDVTKVVPTSDKKTDKKDKEKQDKDKQVWPPVDPEPDSDSDSDPDPDPGVQPEPPQPEPDIQYDQERVIMLYLDGCDIESSFAQSTQNLLEILTAGVPDNTRFFIASGGTLKWYMDAELIYQSYAQRVLYPAKRGDLSPEEKEKVNTMAKDLYSRYKEKFSGMQYWEVVKQDDGYYKLDKLEDIQGYMTDQLQLTKFIDYCTEKTFAKNYDLILYDHGLGLLGYGNDDLLKKYYEENPTLPKTIPTTYTISALSDAIGMTELAMAGRKLELLCFDACKMANYEVASQFTPYANYFIASEEIAPGAGWNYYDVLMKLQQDSTIGSEDLAKEFVNDYILKHTRFAGDDKTIRTLLSATNLNSMEFLDDALFELYETLLTNIRDKNAYFDIAGAIGKTGNFGALSGYNPSDEFDLKLFCEALLLDDYPDIKEKSSKVLTLLNEAVVISKQMYYDAGADFGGLYLYFPANAYDRAYTMDREGNALEFVADGVSDNLKSLNEIEANENYKKLITLYAFIKASGNEIGKDWYTGRLGDYNSILEVLLDNTVYKPVAQAVKEDPELEAIAKKVVTKQFEERIRTDDVVINKGNAKVQSGGNTSVVPSEDQAIVEAPKSEIFLAAGDRADVRITARLDGGTVLVGRSGLYSDEPVEGTKNAQGKDVISWNISKFDNKWYTINDQLGSFFVTEIKDKDNYSGYIPVALWFEKDTVNGPEGKTRDEHLRDSLRSGQGIATYVLNAEAENGQIRIDSITKYAGGNFGDTFDVSELKDSYLELLGGFDKLVFDSMHALSLGTIYTEEGFFDIEKRYVEGLSPEYIITDAYGTDYVLNNKNLEGKGLDNFVKEIPKDQQANVFTWAESKKNAQDVRQKAKEEADAKKEEEGTDPIIEYVDPIVVPAKGGTNPTYYLVAVEKNTETGAAQENVSVGEALEIVKEISGMEAAQVPEVTEAAGKAVSEMTETAGEVVSEVTGDDAEAVPNVAGATGEMELEVTGSTDAATSEVAGIVGEALSEVTGDDTEAVPAITGSANAAVPGETGGTDNASEVANMTTNISVNGTASGENANVLSTEAAAGGAASISANEEVAGGKGDTSATEAQTSEAVNNSAASGVAGENVNASSAVAVAGESANVSTAEAVTGGNPNTSATSEAGGENTNVAASEAVAEGTAHEP